MKYGLNLASVTRVFRRWCCGLGMTGLALLLPARAETTASSPEPEAVVYLVLDQPPAVRRMLDARVVQLPTRAAAAARAQLEVVRQQQDAVAARLHEFGGRELGRASRLVNVIRVAAPGRQVSRLAALPGVSRVQPARRYYPLVSSSAPFVGAARAWSLASGGLTGQGIRIGIIDTGIDYFHAHFGGSGVATDYTGNNRTVVEPGTFPTLKVAGGYDFAGDNYNGDSSTQSTPVPDPDPLDCNGHGTHVAGIAAGFGVTSSGQPYSGSYSNLNPAALAIGPGVAPEAQLYALKVFGCFGSSYLVLEALEWAADPDGDGDFIDHLDVLNISLGSDFGFSGPGDPDLEAINHLAELGCLSAIAGGNSGDVFFITSSPGAAEAAIAVASCLDDGLNGDAAQVLSPPDAAGLYPAVQALFSVPLALSGPIEAQVVYTDPTNACAGLIDPAALAGNIALIDRGDCVFVDKVQRAQEAGALAVIVVNNVAGDPVEMGGSPSYTVTIPAVMITQAAGAQFKSQLGSNLVVRLAAGQGVSRADRVHISSSRGPISAGNLLKPEISAPGDSITSARHGTGSGSSVLTGSSMATPHVAGAAALLRQRRPDWSVEDLKAALMNTAHPMHDAAGFPYPPTRNGAGRLQVDRALETILTVRAESSDGLVALNLGAMEFAAPTNFTRNLVLKNHSTESVTCDISVSNRVTETGFELTPASLSVTVPGLGEVLCPVRIRVSPDRFDRSLDPTSVDRINGVPRTPLFEVGGDIWFFNPVQPVHLPWSGSVRATAEMRSASQTVLPAPDVPSSAVIPLEGQSAHPQPLVSAFQLGAVSPRLQDPGPAQVFADLLAVGAASDAVARGNLSQATLYFGLAAAGDWTSPLSEVIRFEVEIDTTADGQADFTAYNDFVPLPGFTEASDVFASFVKSNLAQNGTTNGWLNVFLPDAYDTAPFNNSVMVLPVRAAALGLLPGHGLIRYRVRSQGPSQRGSEVGEVTEWILFDAERPVLDATASGIQATPFLPDGVPFTLRLDAGAAAVQGLARDRADLLLLHHLNTSGRRHEIVSVALTLAPVLTPPVQVSSEKVFLRWSSLEGLRYALETTVDLNQPFVPLAEDLAATPPENVFLHLAPASEARFYRVRVMP